MQRARALLGQRPAWSENRVISLVRDAARRSGEPGERFIAKQIFRSSRQCTWLVASPSHVYCVLDDIRKPTPVLKWKEELPRLLASEESFSTRAESRERFPKLMAMPSKRHPKLQVVSFGRPKGWLVSPRLFKDRDVAAGLRQFFETAIFPDQLPHGVYSERGKHDIQIAVSSAQIEGKPEVATRPIAAEREKGQGSKSEG